MTIDEALLRKAQEQAARLAEAERQVLLTRADYNAAVRRLHLAGASLRELADVLRMSHQRVQQIVGAAGGTWWQRAWGSRGRRRDAVCTFCERPPSEVAKLIAGPNVFICDVCVASAERVLAGVPTDPLRKTTGGSSCSFCKKRNRSTRAAVAAGRTAKICEECLRTCRAILNDSPGEPARHATPAVPASRG